MDILSPSDIKRIADDYEQLKKKTKAENRLKGKTTEVFSPDSSIQTWEKRFVSAATEIPVNEFRAFYFDDKNPSVAVHTEIVDHPAINCSSFDGSYGIDAYDFGAYYIGYFDFAAPAAREINIDQSFADSRIIIDGKVVVEGYGDGPILYDFTAGRHKVEIEFVNNYHTVQYSVNLLEPYKTLTAEELAAELKPTSGAEYWYGGARESKDFGNEIQVTLKPSRKPVVLFLSSYNAVDWIFSNTEGTNLKAVVLSSHRSMSAITGLPDTVSVFHVAGFPFVYKMLPTCSRGDCYESHFQELVSFEKDHTSKINRL